MRHLLVIAIVSVAAVGMFVGHRLTPASPSLDHNTHANIDCIHCHHDWAGANGMVAEVGMTCKGCHSGDPDLRGRMQADFHNLCRSCHVTERQAKDHRLLPVARCSECHGRPHF